MPGSPRDDTAPGLGAVLQWTDHVRRPSPLDLRAVAYKEWLHVNLFDLARGTTTLVNVSLHGDPADPRALASAAVVTSSLDGDLEPRVTVVPLAAATVEARALGVPDVARVSLDPAGTAVDVRAVVAGEVVEVRATAVSPELVVETPVPFGSGWIAWRARPRLQVDDGRIAYHDHNWGRWHWGDDAAWEWGVFVGPDDVTLVTARTTDRAHRHGATSAWCTVAGRTRRFHRVRTRYVGRFAGPLRRVPGALAALHADRARPDLPARVEVVADDGVDRIEASIDVHDACQLVTADPAVPGWSFIHELFGSVRYRVRVDGRETTGEGLGVFEHVE